jgi:hypothetical protein
MNENGIEYLLDTSIFRGLSKVAFSSIPKTMSLIASPYCFWELLCHLDEAEAFPKFKSRMMRFKKVWVLDRAWRELETPPEDYVSDNDVIDAALAALQASESLDEFYASVIRDSNGKLRELADCCARAREILSKKEEKFVAFVETVSARITESQLDYSTPEQQYRGAMALLRGEMQAREQASQAQIDRETIINQMYFYYSYVLMLAVRHAYAARIIRPNDLGDAEMCKHLVPTGATCLVTSDKELRLGLQRSCELLLSQSRTQINPDEIVISREQFQERLRII